jgi:hypothetical protein
MGVWEYSKKEVFIQDQTSTPVDFFFSKLKQAPTTVAVATSIDDYTVTITDPTGFVLGDYLGMFNSDDPINNRFYFAEILGVSGSIITLDTPIDFEFQIGDTVASFNRNLNVNGSVTPQIYNIQVGSNATQSIDITRIMISMITATAVDLLKFGDLAKLTRGCVLRRVDGYNNNIFNVKSNGEIANLCFDYTPYESINPSAGQDGAKFRYTFAGQDKHGVAVRLAPGDELQLIIQDDLTGLTEFRIIAEGHFVVN